MNNKHSANIINGILLLDKPLEMTSNGALQRVKRLFGAKKAGHTGSLDPLATGMLPICFGEATKFSQFLLDSDKYYSVTLRLGVRTTTGDAEGEVFATGSIEGITRKKVEQVLEKFIGSIEQIPPMYSAVKYQGKPLYKLARRGIEVERQPRPVHIHAIDLKAFSSDTIEIDVHCSKGTYIRTLVDDIGLMLTCGASVAALRRIAVSPYQAAKMVDLSTLEEMYQQQGGDCLRRYLLPLESSVQSLPAVNVVPTAAFYLCQGQSVMIPQVRFQGLVRLFVGTQFLGIGEMQEDGRVIPKRLLN